MKKKLLIGFFLILGVSAFSAVLYTANWQEIQQALSQMTTIKLATFLTLTLLGYFTLFTWRWKLLLSYYGHKVSFWSLLLYKLSGYGISYITPTQIGGEPARIYFLKQNHNIPLKEATASVLMDKLIEVSSFVAFVASGVLIVSFSDLVPDSTLLPIGAMMAGFVALITYVFKRIYRGEHILTALYKRLGLNSIKRFVHLEEKIIKTEQLLTDFVSHKGHRKSTLPWIVILSIAGWSMTIIEYKLLASFLGFGLTWFESFLVATIPLIAYLLPVPAGLGMLEGAQVGMFSLLGYGSGQAIAVVVLVRFKEIFFSIIGFAYTLTHGFSVLGAKKNQLASSTSARTKPRKITSQKTPAISKNKPKRTVAA